MLLSQLAQPGVPMGYDSIITFSYLAPQLQYSNVTSPWGSTGQFITTGTRVPFVFLPNHDEYREVTQRDFPDGGWSATYSSRGELLFWLYEYERYFDLSSLPLKIFFHIHS